MLHITNIKPMFTAVLTTGNKYENDETEGGVITAKQGELKLYQEVIAVGSAVRDIKAGDKVMIDPKRYAVKKYNKNSIQNDMDNNPVLTYQLPWETIEDENGNAKEYLILDSSDIRYVFDGYETHEDNKSSIIIPKTKLIL